MKNAKKIINLILSAALIITCFFDFAYAASTEVALVDCQELIVGAKKYKGRKGHYTSLAEAEYLEHKNEEIFENTALVRLIRAEILHSYFFENSIRMAAEEVGSTRLQFKFDTPKRIYDLNDKKTDLLAAKIYQFMAIQFDRGADLPLEDSKWSRKVFYSFPSAVVIDKIGEALLVVGKENRFIDSDKAIASLSEMKTAEGLGMLGGALGIIGSGWATLAAYDTAALFMSGGFWTFFGGSAAAFVLSKYMRKKRFEKAPESVVRRRLEAHNSIGRKSQSDKVDINSQELSQTLVRINEQIEYLSQEERVPLFEKLMFFGSDAVNLQRDLERSFNVDLRIWIESYAQNSYVIKKYLEAFRNQNYSIRNEDINKFNFLVKVLGEAIEATGKTLMITQSIMNVIDSDYSKVQSMEFVEEGSDKKSLELGFLKRQNQEHVERFLLDARLTNRTFIDALLSNHRSLIVMKSSIDKLFTLESVARSDKSSGEVRDIISELAKSSREMDHIVDLVKSRGSIVEGTATEIEQ